MYITFYTVFANVAKVIFFDTGMDIQFSQNFYLTIRPRGGMDYESIAHEAVGRMGYYTPM